MYMGTGGDSIKDALTVFYSSFHTFYESLRGHLSLKIFFILIILLSGLVFAFLVLTGSFENPGPRLIISGCPSEPQYGLWLTYSVFCLLFALPFFNFRRPRSLRNLDLFMLLLLTPSLLLSCYTYSLILLYVPLIYFFMRMLHETQRASPDRLNVNFNKKIMKILVIILVGYSVISIANANIGDSGLFSGAGGYYLLEEYEYPYMIDVCYFEDAETPCYERDRYRDYGPATYLILSPLMYIFPYDGGSPGEEGFLRSPYIGLTYNIKTAFLIFFLLSVLGLKLLGNRIGGAKFGTVILYAWLANPLTQSNLSWLNNDIIPFTLIIWGLYFISRPLRSGILLALASQVKYYSAPLFPLWALMYKGKRMLIFVTVFVALSIILVGSVAWSNGFGVLDKVYSPAGSIFNFGHSIWHLNPGLADFKNLFLVPLIIPFYILVYLYAFFRFRKKGDRDFYVLLSLSLLPILTLMLLSGNLNFNYMVWIIGLIIPVILRERKYQLPIENC